MSQILIQLVQQGAPITNNTRVGTQVVVSDTKGSQPAVTLNGSEDTPWSLTANVSGDGSITATDVDAAGNTIGTPVVQTYQLGSTGGGGTQQLATSGIQVTVQGDSGSASASLSRK